MKILFIKALEWFGENATAIQREQAKNLQNNERLGYIFNCYVKNQEEK